MTDPHTALLTAPYRLLASCALVLALGALFAAAALLAVATWALVPSDDEPRRVADTGGVYVWVSA